jgi:hypothetical protein
MPLAVRALEFEKPFKVTNKLLTFFSLQRGNNFESLKDFSSKGKASSWLGLAYAYRILLTAVSHNVTHAPRSVYQLKSSPPACIASHSVTHKRNVHLCLNIFYDAPTSTRTEPGLCRAALTRCGLNTRCTTKISLPPNLQGHVAKFAPHKPLT